MPHPTNIEVSNGQEKVYFDYKGEQLTAEIQHDQEGDCYFIWYDSAEKPHVEFIY